MNRITDKMLRGACRKQRALFRETWPNGAPVTTATVRKAYRLGLGVEWLLAHLLSSPLWAEYQRQVAPLYAEYKRQRAALWEEYKRQEAPLWEEYEQQLAPIVASLLRKALEE